MSLLDQVYESIHNAVGEQLIDTSVSGWIAALEVDGDHGKEVLLLVPTERSRHEIQESLRIDALETKTKLFTLERDINKLETRQILRIGEAISSCYNGGIQWSKALEINLLSVEHPLTFDARTQRILELEPAAAPKKAVASPSLTLKESAAAAGFDTPSEMSELMRLLEQGTMDETMFFEVISKLGKYK